MQREPIVSIPAPDMDATVTIIGTYYTVSNRIEVATRCVPGRYREELRGYSCQRCGRGISEYQYYHQTFPICEGRK